MADARAHGIYRYWEKLVYRGQTVDVAIVRVANPKLSV